MNKILITISVLSACIWAQNAVTINSQAQEKLVAGMKTEKFIVPVNTDHSKYIQENMRKWVGNFIDLNKNQLKESKTFNRSYCKVVPTVDPIMLLTTTPKNSTPNAFTTKKAEDPIALFYHEGPSYFSFTKEKDSRALTKMTLNDAAEVVKRFVLENEFIQLTQQDKIGVVETFETKIDEDNGSPEDSDVYLVRQDIVLYRFYAGKPVFNSKLRVSFNPDNMEVLELTKQNWSVLDENGTRKMDAINTGKEDLFGQMKSKILKNAPKAKKVEISKVQDGWFQSDNELLPVVYFEYNSYFANETEARTSGDMINISGDNSIFMKDFRNKYRNEYQPSR
jgi:hypothetical protein